MTYKCKKVRIRLIVYRDFDNDMQFERGVVSHHTISILFEKQ